MEENNKKNELEIDDFDSWLREHDRQKAIEEEELRLKIQKAKTAALAAQHQPKENPTVETSEQHTPTEPKTRTAEPKAGTAEPKPGTADPKAGATQPQPRPKAAQPTKQPENKPLADTQANQADAQGNIPISRREMVKNFHVDIDENALRDAGKQTEEPPRKDKAVYFANHQPTKAESERRRQQAANLQKQKKEEQRRLNAKRKKERKRIRRLKRLLSLCLIVICSALLANYTISCINDVLALGRGTEIVTVSIEKGANSEAIIDALAANNLIKHKWFCKLFTNYRHFDQKKYLNGVYYLTPNMGVEGMLNEMRENQMSDETIRLYFPEGWTIQQIVEKLDANNVCPKEYIYTALRDVTYDNSFYDQIPTDGRYFRLEGYLFPDTYDFFVSEKAHGIGENPSSVVRKLLNNFDSKWTEIYDKRAKELGLTQDEVIIIASIIQKEAANKEQMTQISSVIHNRLNNPSSYPTLGCDSTKNYVTTYLTQAIGTAAASPYTGNYDTNGTRAGLPAGPICNPGLDAIEAALNPDDTKYFYFCHNNKGKIYLAKTYEEFQRNWTQVLKDNEASE